MHDYAFLLLCLTAQMHKPQGRGAADCLDKILLLFWPISIPTASQVPILGSSECDLRTLSQQWPHAGLACPGP